MIVDFTIENWLSFKESSTLSFVAQPPYSNLSNHLMDTPDNSFKLLKSVIIYGANASGKSNFLSALEFLKSVVTKSEEKTVDDIFGFYNFLLDKNSRKEPTSFELNFFCEGIRYNYMLILDNYKVHYESLSSYPKKAKRNMFTRELLADGKYDFNAGMDLKPKRIYDDIFKKTLPNVLFLSKAVKENSEVLKPVFQWFKNSLSEDLSIQQVAEKIHEDDNFKKELINFLCKNDISIVDITLDKQDLVEQIMKDEKIPQVLKDSFLNSNKEHYFYDIQSVHNDSDGDIVNFDFKLESKGTHKLFKLSSLMENSSELSKTFYVDELSADLHPLLVKSFINAFHTNCNNQLIAVTHDTHLINSDTLRKDQIYFVEKNKSQASEMYSLLEFKPRGDRENWELRYLSGRYGATPLLMNP